MKRKTSKLLSALLALCMVLALLPGAALAAATSGTCGDNLTWTLDAGGTLTISGTGSMKDYELSQSEGGFDPAIAQPWGDSSEQIKAVVIGDGVTGIGKSAFGWCQNLTAVTIGKDVASIGELAFWQCPKLSGVTIPDGVTSIGGSAFSACDSLKSVTIPDSVTAIGASAFSYCTKLSSVTVPESVTAIGQGAFDGTPWQEGLGDLAVVNGILLKYQGKSNAVVIPSSVTSIGEYAFAGYETLDAVTIPGSVTAIGKGAFSGCTGLMNAIIPDGVTAIGERTFETCWCLTDVTIPGSVTAIGENAFGDCRSLTDVYYGGSEEQWKQVEVDERNNDALTDAIMHYAGGNTTPSAPAGISVTVWGKTVEWADVKPFVDANNRTMVPLRAVGEELNLLVDWDANARIASFTGGSTTISFPIGGSTAATSDGRTIEMDTAAVIVNSRTYAPIRYLAEYFGFTVGWDQATKTVSIT